MVATGVSTFSKLNIPTYRSFPFVMQSASSISSQWPSTSTSMDDWEMPQPLHTMQLDLTEDEITDLRESVHSILELDTSMRSVSPVPTPPPRLSAYEILTMLDNMPYMACNESQNALLAPMVKIESTSRGLAFIPEISANAHLMSEVDQWNREYASKRPWHPCPTAFTCAGPACRQHIDRELPEWPIDVDGFPVDLDLDEPSDDVFMGPHDNTSEFNA